MKLTPAQKKIANCSKRFRVVCCGRRFGKTTLSAYEMLGYAIAEKNRRIAYYAPTRDDAREIVWNMLKSVAEDAITYINESRLEIRVATEDGGESMIVLYGWESVQERGKGRGVANDFIVLDEVAGYRNFWEAWEEVLRPTISDTGGDALFISTPKGFNHFYDLYNKENTDKDYKSFHFTSYDNTVPGLVAALHKDVKKAQLEMDPDRFAQEYMADFRKMEGLVYKDFNRDRHIYRKFEPDEAEVLVGIDFGFTNPTAILRIVRGRDGIYYITDEWYKSGKTTREITEVARNFEPNAVYADPAEPDRIKDLSDNGLYCMDVSKKVEAGIAAVVALFRADRIRVHESCENVINELETYHYEDSDKRKTDKNRTERPVKSDDHAMDALRYVLYSNAGASGRLAKEKDGVSPSFQKMLKKKRENSKPKTLFI